MGASYSKGYGLDQIKKVMEEIVKISLEKLNY